MKLKQIKSVFAALFVFIAMAVAGLGADTNAVSSASLYRANEFSLATFGTYQVSGTETGDGAWGVGLQADYFVTENLGASLSTVRNQFGSGSFIQNLSIAPVFRFPVADTGFAPYATAGVSVAFDQGNERYYFVGGGLEYRFTPNVGAFADYQHVFRGDQPGVLNDAQVIRTGLRWAF